MTNAELIAALRYCSDNENEEGCDECPYLHNGMCRTMLSDAAYALEAAGRRIARLEEDLKTREAEREVLQDTIKICEEAADRYKAQLPKEGEWIVEEIDDGGFKWRKWRCSVCREVVKKGWQHTKDGEKPKWKHCPNCGSVMKGEQQ